MYFTIGKSLTANAKWNNEDTHTHTLTHRSEHRVHGKLCLRGICSTSEASLHQTCIHIPFIYLYTVYVYLFMQQKIRNSNITFIEHIHVALWNTLIPSPSRSAAQCCCVLGYLSYTCSHCGCTYIYISIESPLLCSVLHNNIFQYKMCAQIRIQLNKRAKENMKSAENDSASNISVSITMLQIYRYAVLPYCNRRKCGIEHEHTSAHTCSHANRLDSEKSWSCINFVASLKYFKSDTHMPQRFDADVDVDGADIVHLFMRNSTCHQNGMREIVLRTTQFSIDFMEISTKQPFFSHAFAKQICSERNSGSRKRDEKLWWAVSI